jgi:hypothetical protein
MFGLGIQELVILGLVGLLPVAVLVWVVRNSAGGRKADG